METVCGPAADPSTQPVRRVRSNEIARPGARVRSLPMTTGRYSAASRAAGLSFALDFLPPARFGFSRMMWPTAVFEAGTV